MKHQKTATEVWLCRYRYIQQQIQQLDMEKTEIYNDLCRITPNYGGERVQTFSINSREILFAQLAEKQQEIDRETAKKYAVKKQIENAIADVTDERLQLLLKLRYINCIEWERIADVLGLKEPRHVYRLHNNALAQIETGRGV